MIEYSVYSETLKSRSIFNIVGPRDHTDYRQKALDREERLLKKNKGFYERLEQDVLTNGFINPIIVVRNKWFTMEWGIGDQCKPACPQYGGSRLWIAQKHDLDIPAIICDYDGKFSLINIDAEFKTPHRYKMFRHYIEAEIEK